ncbi:MAG: hypothetical protein O6703_03200 [Gammaproteobacteria bacterium]|nr:hypothetical protein [Gammaproteobacteria bacterium]
MGVLVRLELQGEVPSLINRSDGCEFHPRCPFVQENCRTRFPELSLHGENHSYRCHYPRHAD